jgi:NAD(P)-dependent dehydrogenase (short-subunit alcohol dehydrogenase family)
MVLSEAASTRINVWSSKMTNKSHSLYPDLSNVTMLVTGANGGIGFDIVKSALMAGASLLATDLAIEEKLEIMKIDCDLECRNFDLCDDDQREECISWANKSKANSLVNNAAIFDMAPLLEADLDQFDKLFALNVRAMFAMMQGFAKGLISRNEAGTIINFSSQAGRRGEALVSHYCATKAAVISYTQSAALALAQNSIRVNAIAPGVVDTPMWDTVDSLFARYEGLSIGEKKKKVSKSVPLGRFGLPSDVTGAVLFLASSHSEYITGQTINVDGGSVLS